jgi:hypothetical protein
MSPEPGLPVKQGRQSQKRPGPKWLFSQQLEKGAAVLAGGPGGVAHVASDLKLLETAAAQEGLTAATGPGGNRAGDARRRDSQPRG